MHGCKKLDEATLDMMKQHHVQSLPSRLGGSRVISNIYIWPPQAHHTKGSPNFQLYFMQQPCQILASKRGRLLPPRILVTVWQSHTRFSSFCGELSTCGRRRGVSFYVPDGDWVYEQIPKSHYFWTNVHWLTKADAYGRDLLLGENQGWRSHEINPDFSLFSFIILH